MLKQIGVRLEEDLIKKVKLTAIEEGISVQTIFKTALESYFDNKLTSKQDNKSTSKQDKKITNKQVKKKEEPTPTPTPVSSASYVSPYYKYDNPLEDDTDPMDERYYYVLRKPEFESLPEPERTTKTNNMVDWDLEKGDSQVFDKDNYIIPFTYRKANGKMRTPTPSEINLLKTIYGKPVTIEE